MSARIGMIPAARLRNVAAMNTLIHFDIGSSTLGHVLVDGRRATLGLPLDAAGTPFQQRVWNALRGIPAGKTASYADIARRIDAPNSFRAVAQACGANPLALAIPCHRVVRNDGALSGYRWGVARKRALLEREAAR